MNRIQTTAVAVLLATLPYAPSAFAHDRDHDGRDAGRHARYERHDHDRGWHHGYRHHYRHHHQSYYRSGRDHGYDSGYHYPIRDRWEQPRVSVVVPVPLPPLPVIVLKKHHDPRVVLRPAY